MKYTSNYRNLQADLVTTNSAGSAWPTGKASKKAPKPIVLNAIFATAQYIRRAS